MCLAIPGQIKEIRTENDTLMGTIDFDGITKSVCLEYLPEIEVGDYAIVHVGFAISQVDEESAKETIALLRSMGENTLEEELLANEQEAQIKSESE